MDHLRAAVNSFLGGDVPAADIAGILALFTRREKVACDDMAAVVSTGLDETLLVLWEWKLVIPVRYERCSEWDFRILRAEPGEYFEMPNIVKTLVEKGMETGRWESAAAIRDLFRVMGEPEWERMPQLVLLMKREARHNIISGVRIGAACSRCGLGGKTGAMIAVLKGAGVISPKLAAVGSAARARSPLYEFNPSVYAELHVWRHDTRKTTGS